MGARLNWESKKNTGSTACVELINSGYNSFFVAKKLKPLDFVKKMGERQEHEE